MQLPTTNTGVHKNSLSADAYMMEVKVGGRDSQWPVSESSVRLEWSSPFTTNRFQAWMSQGLVSTDIHRGWEASALKACLSHTFGRFCLRQISDSTWLSGKGQKREVTWWGKPSVGENGGWGRKKCEKWVICHAWDPHFFFFFLGFFSFGHDMMWFGCVTNQGCPPFQVFSERSKSPLRYALASTEEMFLKSVKFSRRTRSLKGRKKKKNKKILCGSRTIQKLRSKASEGRGAGVNSSWR